MLSKDSSSILDCCVASCANHEAVADSAGETGKLVKWWRGNSPREPHIKQVIELYSQVALILLAFDIEDRDKDMFFLLYMHPFMLHPKNDQCFLALVVIFQTILTADNRLILRQ